MSACTFVSLFRDPVSKNDFGSLYNTMSKRDIRADISVTMEMAKENIRPVLSGDDEDDGLNGGNGTGVVTKTRQKTQKPSLYKVLLLNDDYTPMEFVIHILEQFFGKGREEATQIMLHVHQKGVGVCGVYTYEVAETKVTQVMDFARQHQHPLQCTMEKE